MAREEVSAVLADRRECGGTCPLSTNEHVHFHGRGFRAFAADLIQAARRPDPPEPPTPDPALELAARWEVVFQMVCKAMDAHDELNRLKAADVASAILGLRR